MQGALGSVAPEPPFGALPSRKRTRAPPTQPKVACEGTRGAARFSAQPARSAWEHDPMTTISPSRTHRGATKTTASGGLQAQAGVIRLRHAIKNRWMIASVTLERIVESRRRTCPVSEGQCFTLARKVQALRPTAVARKRSLYSSRIRRPRRAPSLLLLLFLAVWLFHSDDAANAQGSTTSKPATTPRPATSTSQPIATSQGTTPPPTVVIQRLEVLPPSSPPTTAITVSILTACLSAATSLYVLYRQLNTTKLEKARDRAAEASGSAGDRFRTHYGALISDREHQLRAERSSLLEYLQYAEILCRLVVNEPSIPFPLQSETSHDAPVGNLSGPAREALSDLAAAVVFQRSSHVARKPALPKEAAHEKVASALEAALEIMRLDLDRLQNELKRLAQLRDNVTEQAALAEAVPSPAEDPAT